MLKERNQHELEQHAAGSCSQQEPVKRPYTAYAVATAALVIILLLGVHSYSTLPGSGLHQLLFSNSSRYSQEPVDPFFETQFSNWSDSVLEELTPASIQHEFRGQASRLQLDGGATHLPLHWAIVSCDRGKWARSMTMTLLSGLLNDLNPDTITIAYCKPFDRDQPLPSLLFNLRLSRKFDVVYLPPQLPVAFSSTYLLALLVPRLRHQPNKLLLVTEDDVVFAPDMNARLAQLVADAEGKARGRPYLLDLYNPPQEVPQGSRDELLARYNSQDAAAEQERLAGVAEGPGPTHKAGAVKQSRLSYWYGAQGTLFSPGMAKYMARHFYQIQMGVQPLGEGFGGLQDHVVKYFLEKYQCSFKYDPGARCHVFNSEPSLINHIGTISTSSNLKFHMAVDFPMTIAFPSMDKEELWA